MDLRPTALLFALLPALALALPPAPSAGPATPAAPVQAEASIFGEPLFVNGRRVTDQDIQRYLIYGPCRLQLEIFRVGLIIEDELDRRARTAADEAVEERVGPGALEAAEKRIAEQEAAKPFESPEARASALSQEVARQRAERMKDPAIAADWNKTRDARRRLLEEQLVPTEEEFEAEYRRTRDEFKKNYPVLNLDAEISRAFRTVGWYRDNLLQTMYFDRVFYPEDPDEWPITTIEAVRADSQDVLLEDAKQSYKMRKEYAAKTGEPLPKEDGLYTQMMRQIVRDAMFATVDWRTAFDGLAGDLVLTADRDFDGKPELVVRTEELWNKVKDTVAPTEIEEAKRWYVTSWATHDRLEKEGALLDAEGRAKALAELKKQFEGTYFNVDILATQTYFFPSTENYLEFHLMLEALRKRIEPELATMQDGGLPPRLAEYLPTANNIMGLGQVDVEIMLISAFDIPNFRWKENGWQWARSKAEEVKALLDANQVEHEAQRAERAAAQAEGREYTPAKEFLEPYRFWSQLMDEHSEYWDPPAPEQGRASDVGMKNRGRFGARYRNDLQGYVGETPYTHWVTGASITDHVFSDQALETVDGPFRGPQGWYLTRVQRRTPPSRPLNLSDPKHVDLLRDDYVRNRAFVQYAKEARLAAEVRGFDFGY
jgi:hypothetical protein